MAKKSTNPFDPEEDVINAPRTLGQDPGESLYFDPGSFERRWLTQGSPRTDFKGQREREERLQDLGKRPGEAPADFDPAGPASFYNPNQAGFVGKPERIEEQRGMTLPEADLQAKFLRSRGAYNADPNYEPTEPQSYRLSDLTMFPLQPVVQKGLYGTETEAGRQQWLAADEAKNAPRYLHDTPLDDATDLYKYRTWAAKGGKNPDDEQEDYDLRGYYKAGGKLTPGVHLPDTFKKPNHPSFSDQSKYSGPGQEGGHWLQDNKGRYIGFQAGPANLVHHSPMDMVNYFRQSEPGVQVFFPPGTPDVPPQPEMSTFKERFPEMTPMEEYNERQRKKRERK